MILSDQERSAASGTSPLFKKQKFLRRYAGGAPIIIEAGGAHATLAKPTVWAAKTWQSKST
jgi:hypothetical protein